MGVELGKVLAKNILKQLDKPENVIGHDSSVRSKSTVRPPLPPTLTSLPTDDRPHSLVPEASQGIE